MTWMKFAIWLFGMYTIYYAALLLWDFLCSNRSATESDSPELTFVEDIVPVKSHSEETAGNSVTSPVTFSGGVSLKQLFHLAREESVEYIKSVSF